MDSRISGPPPTFGGHGRINFNGLIAALRAAKSRRDPVLYSRRARDDAKYQYEVATTRPFDSGCRVGMPRILLGKKELGQPTRPFKYMESAEMKERLKRDADKELHPSKVRSIVCCNECGRPRYS